MSRRRRKHRKIIVIIGSLETPDHVRDDPTGLADHRQTAIVDQPVISLASVGDQQPGSEGQMQTLAKKIPPVNEVPSLLQSSSGSTQATEASRLKKSDVAPFMIHIRRKQKIIIVRGRGGQLTESDINAAEKWIARSQLVMVQLHVPVGVIRRSAALARKHRVRVLLDPAPMMDLSEKLRRLK